MLIYFCDTCKARIPAAEMEAKTAVFLDEGRALCAKCAAARKNAKPSRSTIRVASRTSESGKTPAAAGIATKGQAGGTPKGAAAPAPAIAFLDNLKIAIPVGCVGLILFVIGIIVAFSGGGTVDAGGGADHGKKSGAASAIKRPVAPAAKPRTARNDPHLRPGGAAKDPKAAVGTSPEPAKNQPAASATAVVEPAKITPIVVPAAQPGETIWVEDALPPGASGDGTLKADSWKWAAQPEPVSGTHSHTMNVAEGQPNPPGPQRHSFHDANPPLQVSPADVLFTYVYLDPKDPPKEIMLEWQFRGSWEHRAYWGQDEIQDGNNFSPSRMQSGPLPKTGEWVRLEVRASEIGVEAEQEPVTGWSFAQFGGVAYWDRSGVVAKPKAAVVAAPPVPLPPMPDPSKEPPKPAVPAVTPANPEPAAVQVAASGKLSWRDFKGGIEHKDKKHGGLESRAIYAKSTQKNTLQAAFELGAKRNGFGMAELVTKTYLHSKPPCQIALLINGKEIFNGRDTATKKEQWGEQRYPIPTGVLRAGKNEIRIENLEPTGEDNKEPWYMVHSVDVVLAPDFPPITSDAQHALIQACDRVEQLARKELDPPAKFRQELALVKAAAAPELQPLAALLEKAQALYNQALANLAKTPPTEQVRIEKLKLTGTVVRVAGGKAVIKSQGMEMSVDVASLPQTAFLKALALDESKPASLADKAAFCWALGNEDPVQALLKRFKKEDLPPWTAFFDLRKTLNALAKFETSVNNVEALLKSAKPADALPALEALKKEYPELAEANKERISYLAAAAEARK